MFISVVFAMPPHNDAMVSDTICRCTLCPRDSSEADIEFQLQHNEQVQRKYVDWKYVTWVLLGFEGLYSIRFIISLHSAIELYKVDSIYRRIIA